MTALILMSQQCLPDEYAVDPPLIHQVSKTQGADSQNVELKDTIWESINYLMASQYLSWTLERWTICAIICSTKRNVKN